jgi:rod shape-determining protein MreD
VGAAAVSLVVLLATALVILKTTVLEPVRIAGVLPDLFLALVVYASFFRGAAGGLVSGAAVGVVVELASTDGRGFYPALYGVCGWLAGIGWERIMRRSLLSEFLFLAVLGFLVDATLVVGDGALRGGLALALGAVVLPSALATGIAGPIAFAASSRALSPFHVGVPTRAHGKRR